MELKSDTTPFYTLTHGGKHYAAVFNFSPEEQTLSFRAARGGLPEQGIARDLWTGSGTEYHGDLSVTLPGHDCAIFEILQPASD